MIFVDDREPERLVQLLRSMGVDVRRKRLEIGDYLVTNSSREVAVERKSVEDFESSIIDGRLFDQVHRLSKKYPLSFLCIVGSESSESSGSDSGRSDRSESSESKESKGKVRISRDAFVGGILSVALTALSSGTVIPLRLESEEEFCLMLKNLDRKLSSGKLKVYPRIVRKTEVDDSVAMLTAIPGIGVEKAKRLLERFGSVHAVVNASIADLKRVDGIGDKQARRIYYFVRGLRIR